MAARAPLVSIIIPCYITTRTQADLLAETLATVSAQAEESPERWQRLLSRRGSSSILPELGEIASGDVPSEAPPEAGSTSDTRSIQ
ncbi:hypothetical protein BH24ACI4_BH24ACI4_16450 [soil metagenome]